MNELVSSHGDALQDLRMNLRAELAQFEANLPAEIQDISEEHERYARVVMLMLRSLDMLIKSEHVNKKTNDTNIDKTEEVRATRDIVVEIERRLDRIASTRQANDISEDTQ